MTGDPKDTRAGGARRARAEPSPKGAPSTDPELSDDLGPELELRGEELEAALQAARAEAAEWRERALRTQADFENTRRRLTAQHADAVLRASERVVLALLPVIDNLERAIDHVTTGAVECKDLLQGVEIVHKQLFDVLAREGVEVVDPFGQPFDPHKHEAVQTRVDPDIPEHTVVEVFQKGYEMHGRMIRHAMVAVSTGGPTPPKE